MSTGIQHLYLRTLHLQQAWQSYGAEGARLPPENSKPVTTLRGGEWVTKDAFLLWVHVRCALIGLKQLHHAHNQGMDASEEQRLNLSREYHDLVNHAWRVLAHMMNSVSRDGMPGRNILTQAGVANRNIFDPGLSDTEVKPPFLDGYRYEPPSSKNQQKTEQEQAERTSELQEISRKLKLREAMFSGRTPPPFGQHVRQQIAEIERLLLALHPALVPSINSGMPATPMIIPVDTGRSAKPRMPRIDVKACSACHTSDDLIRLNCQLHFNCPTCLATFFDIGFHNTVESFPPRCCRYKLALTLLSGWISIDKYVKYEDKIIERTTVRPVYCHGCNFFIRADQIVDNKAWCWRCRLDTCVSCRKKSHEGPCSEDTEKAAVLKLAETKKWQQCKRCNTLVEKSEGCNHMTCTCGNQFCYLCGSEKTDHCGCAQFDREWNDPDFNFIMGLDGIPRMPDDPPGGRRAPPPNRARAVRGGRPVMQPRPNAQQPMPGMQQGPMEEQQWHAARNRAIQQAQEQHRQAQEQEQDRPRMGPPGIDLRARVRPGMPIPIVDENFFREEREAVQREGTPAWRGWQQDQTEWLEQERLRELERRRDLLRRAARAQQQDRAAGRPGFMDQIRDPTEDNTDTYQALARMQPRMQDNMTPGQAADRETNDFNIHGGRHTDATRPELGHGGDPALMQEEHQMRIDFQLAERRYYGSDNPVDQAHGHPLDREAFERRWRNRRQHQNPRVVDESDDAELQLTGFQERRLRQRQNPIVIDDNNDSTEHLWAQEQRPSQFIGLFGADEPPRRLDMDTARRAVRNVFGTGETTENGLAAPTQAGQVPLRPTIHFNQPSRSIPAPMAHSRLPRSVPGLREPDTRQRPDQGPTPAFDYTQDLSQLQPDHLPANVWNGEAPDNNRLRPYLLEHPAHEGPPAQRRRVAVDYGPFADDNLANMAPAVTREVTDNRSAFTASIQALQQTIQNETARTTFAQFDGWGSQAANHVPNTGTEIAQGNRTDMYPTVEAGLAFQGHIHEPDLNSTWGRDFTTRAIHGRVPMQPRWTATPVNLFTDPAAASQIFAPDPAARGIREATPHVGSATITRVQDAAMNRRQRLARNQDEDDDAEASTRSHRHGQ